MVMIPRGRSQLLAMLSWKRIVKSYFFREKLKCFEFLMHSSIQPTFFASIGTKIIITTFIVREIWTRDRAYRCCPLVPRLKLKKNPFKPLQIISLQGLLTIYDNSDGNFGTDWCRKLLAGTWATYKTKTCKSSTGKKRDLHSNLWVPPFSSNAY